jgi:hypothetical protein
MPVETSVDSPPRIPPRRLWFGSVGAAVAWALQGFTCFQIAVEACASGTGYWGPLSPAGVRILIGCVSAAYLAVAAASCFISYQNWKRLTEARGLMEAEGYGREEYMALAGIFVGITAGVGLIWSGLPPIFCNVCNTFR